MSSKRNLTLSLALVLAVLVSLLGQLPSSCLVSAASFGGHGAFKSQMFDLDEDEDTFGDRPGQSKRDGEWLAAGTGGGMRGGGGSSGSEGIGAGTLINEREPRETNVRRPLIFKRETNVRKPLLFKRQAYSTFNDFEDGPSKRISGSPLSRHWSGNRRPRPAGRPTILYI